MTKRNIQQLLDNKQSIVSKKNPTKNPSKIEYGITYILNGDKGEIHTLNESAALIWSLLDKPQTIEVLLQKMVKEFAISETKLKTDLDIFLNDFIQEGLLEIETPT
jgi:hypothetical protein